MYACMFAYKVVHFDEYVAIMFSEQCDWVYIVPN